MQRQRLKEGKRKKERERKERESKHNKLRLAEIYNRIIIIIVTVIGLYCWEPCGVCISPCVCVSAEYECVWYNSSESVRLYQVTVIDSVTNMYPMVLWGTVNHAKPAQPVYFSPALLSTQIYNDNCYLALSEVTFSSKRSCNSEAQ